MSKNETLLLKEIAKKVRLHCIEMISKAGSGHPGSCLSAVDILVTVFYNWMKRSKQNALLKDRDKFVLSKGHAVPVLYAIFAELSMIDKEELKTFRELNSRLQGHPDVTKLPYVEASTGSLGQGLSVAQGMALAARLNDYPARVYCMIGDGEIQEGQIWEAFMSASKMKLSNLTVILDYNRLQIDGPVSDVMPIEPIREKLEAFSWEVFEVDGHDFNALIELKEKVKKVNDKPQFIIAKTIKGKGVSFMENQVSWHGKAPNKSETIQALKELSSI